MSDRPRREPLDLQSSIRESAVRVSERSFGDAAGADIFEIQRGGGKRLNTLTRTPMGALAACCGQPRRVINSCCHCGGWRNR